MTWSSAKPADSRSKRPDDAGTSTVPLPLTATLAQDGPMRLDAALAPFFPGLGLRARRRLWDWCRVFVNGRAAEPGLLVRPGDRLRVERGPKAPAPPPSVVAFSIMTVAGDMVALCKPGGLHTAHIQGGAEQSLETLLASRWAELWRRYAQTLPTCDAPPPPAPRLLTRLDKATSGLVLGALRPEAEHRFRLAEQEGLVQKNYLALVRGRLARPLTLQGRLRTDNRQQTLVLDDETPDITRHTRVDPLSHGRPAPEAGEPCPHTICTLVRVRIRRGARHQIRAHLAHAGFPLVGEWLYAPRDAFRLRLHHAAVRMPGFTADCPPDWPWPEGLPALGTW